MAQAAKRLVARRREIIKTADARIELNPETTTGPSDHPWSTIATPTFARTYEPPILTTTTTGTLQPPA